MAKYFKLTDEYIEVGFTKLFRIECTKTFKYAKRGDKGGFVEKEDNLSGNAWVYGNARVYGNAWVFGNARVYGNAWVSGDAWVYGDARVYGDAWVYGDARVYGNARVYGDAWVYGDARVSGDAREESPLQIQGTRHYFNICKKNTIRIGCLEMTIEEWEKKYKEVGKNEGYTENQIKEYGLYIKLAKELSKL